MLEESVSGSVDSDVVRLGRGMLLLTDQAELRGEIGLIVSVVTDRRSRKNTV